MEFLLRLLAGVLGVVLFLFVVPIVVFGGIVTSGDTSSEVILNTLGFFIFSTAGFILIAVLGNRVVLSLKLRVTTAILLAIPIYFTAMPLVQLNPPEFWPYMLSIFLFSLLQFSAFVWPAWLKATLSKSA